MLMKWVLRFMGDLNECYMQTEFSMKDQALNY